MLNKHSKVDTKLDESTSIHVIIPTSIQSPAMKNPTVLAGIFEPRGLIEIFVSPPSSGLTSRANSKSLSFTKQSLNDAFWWNLLRLRRESLLCSLAEGHARESWWEGLSVHFASSALDVVVLPARVFRALRMMHYYHFEHISRVGQWLFLQQIHQMQKVYQTFMQKIQSANVCNESSFR